MTHSITRRFSNIPGTLSRHQGLCGLRSPAVPQVFCMGYVRPIGHSEAGRPIRCASDNRCSDWWGRTLKPDNTGRIMTGSFARFDGVIASRSGPDGALCVAAHPLPQCHDGGRRPRRGPISRRKSVPSPGREDWRSMSARPGRIEHRDPPVIYRAGSGRILAVSRGGRIALVPGGGKC